MIGTIMIVVGAAFVIFWGISHLFPTKSIVKGFGDISPDNKKIISMEWINEGATLIFIGTLAIATNLIDPGNRITLIVNIISIIMLLAISVISLFTGFRIRYLPFRLCPVIFTTSAILILIGSLF